MQDYPFVSLDSELALALIDVQEKLFPLTYDHETVGKRLRLLLQAWKRFNLPLVVTEQYPAGLGSTVPELRSLMEQQQLFGEKLTFSCVADAGVCALLDATGADTWVLAGIETHVCVFQTAVDLLRAGKQVILLRDAVSSRRPIDRDSAVEELRHLGVRITTVETLLFELIRKAGTPLFKTIAPMFKS